MNRATFKIMLRSAIGLAAVFLVIGCATETNPPSAPAQRAASPTEPSPYPQWTDADLATLIPGHHILRVNDSNSRRDGVLDDQASVRISKTRGGYVSLHNNGVQIGPWQLWENQTVTVSMPNPGSAIVDYYPHPYHFNGCIRIWLDLSNIDLPHGRRWDEVQFFYVNDQGQLFQYWGQLDLVHMTYSAWPDHFSRYIIALPDE